MCVHVTSKNKGLQERGKHPRQFFPSFFYAHTHTHTHANSDMAGVNEHAKQYQHTLQALTYQPDLHPHVQLGYPHSISLSLSYTCTKKGPKLFFFNVLDFFTTLYLKGTCHTTLTSTVNSPHSNTYYNRRLLHACKCGKQCNHAKIGHQYNLDLM